MITLFTSAASIVGLEMIGARLCGGIVAVLKLSNENNVNWMWMPAWAASSSAAVMSASVEPPSPVGEPVLSKVTPPPVKFGKTHQRTASTPWAFMSIMAGQARALVAATPRVVLPKSLAKLAQA